MDEAPELTGAIDAAWLFDEELYRARYPDLTEEWLVAEGFDGLLQHYLCRGDREGRSGSLFFDPAYYCSRLSAEQAARAVEVGALAHYLRGIDDGGEPRSSIYFDPAWYLDRYPAVAQAIAVGQWRCALHHYLTNDTPAAFDPLLYFSEQFYRARYGDVADAVAAGILRGGYQHFLKHGASELRAPCAGIDLGRYVTDDSAVRDALWTGRARDPFAHYLAHGRAEQAADTRLPTEAEAAALSRARAETMLPVLARRRLEFSCGDDPELSVVLVTCDRLAAVMRTLGLLRTTFAGSIELLLVDAGSQDDTRLIERFVTGARLLRLESDPGRLYARNAALACATAAAVLLLDDAVEPAPGAIEAALRRLGSDPTIGAVGGKVIRPHGRLREAGGIVRNDGTTALYLRDQLPTAPEANFVREVDFCSGLFLLVRRTLLSQLGGFDEGFVGGSEDVDLCLRVAGAGYRVVYDPGVIVHHSGAWPVDSPELLFARHAQHLQSRPPPAPDMQIFARSTRAERRVLFIDDTVPLRMAGS
ncbi:MAG TPA: glycosyltransferase, partial [Acetobacteraceae bacterium]|nr:glycosyltransferase [Acetobacteraceae bacterium]